MENPIAHSHLFYHCFFWLKGKITPYYFWEVFSIFQNDTSKNSFLYQMDSFYFGWTGSGLCYKGSYAYGAPPPAEEALPSGKLYIKGTWTVPFLHEVDIIHGFCFSYIRSIYFLKEKRHHCFFWNCHSLCLISFVVVFVCFLY